MSDKKRTSIGGQALIGGVMMRGPYKTAMAVRNPQGEIVIEEVEPIKALGKKKFLKLPFVRGIFNLIDSMRLGMKSITRSAEIAYEGVEEEEPSKFEERMTKIFGEKFFNIFLGIASVLGVLLGVFLFMYLPSLFFKLINGAFNNALSAYRAVFEGVVKIAIFLAYLKVITLMGEIKTVFRYHGAEHKTIFCYEAGLELTPENVKKFKRFHPRCGTSFMFLMLIVGIIVTFMITAIFDVDALPTVVWVLIKILTIPVLCGIGYEIIKFTGRHDNIFTRIVAAPGLWVQRLTTYEPDDSQIECAIEALKAVIPEDGSDKW